MTITIRLAKTNARQGPAGCLCVIIMEPMVQITYRNTTVSNIILKMIVISFPCQCLVFCNILSQCHRIMLSSSNMLVCNSLWIYHFRWPLSHYKSIVNLQILINKKNLLLYRYTQCAGCDRILDQKLLYKQRIKVGYVVRTSQTFFYNLYFRVPCCPSSEFPSMLGIMSWDCFCVFIQQLITLFNQEMPYWD